MLAAEVWNTNDLNQTNDLFWTRMLMNDSRIDSWIIFPPNGTRSTKLWYWKYQVLWYWILRHKNSQRGWELSSQRGWESNSQGVGVKLPRRGSEPPKAWESNSQGVGAFLPKRGRSLTQNPQNMKEFLEHESHELNESSRIDSEIFLTQNPQN